MPAKPAFELNDAQDAPPPPQSRYVDIDRIVSVEGIVTVFSQRRRDGLITFAVHREIPGDDPGVVSKTAFVPETMASAYAAHNELTLKRLAELQEKRGKGGLPFPAGGEDRPGRSRGRR